MFGKTIWLEPRSRLIERLQMESAALLLHYGDSVYTRSYGECYSLLNSAPSKRNPGYPTAPGDNVRRHTAIFASARICAVSGRGADVWMICIICG